MSDGKSKAVWSWRFLWPKIYDIESARFATQYGFWGASIGSIVSAAVATISLVAQKPILGLDAWTYVDAILMAIVAWRIRSFSRVFAICGVALGVLNVIGTVGMPLPGQASNAFSAAIYGLIVFFINGARGVFAYNRFKPTSVWGEPARARVLNQPSGTMPVAATTITDSATEDKHYEQALTEIESGQTVKAIWARSLAGAEGDEAKARALYISLRVKALVALAEQEQEKVDRDNDTLNLSGNEAAVQESSIAQERSEASIEAQYVEDTAKYRVVAKRIKALGFGKDEVKMQLVAQGLNVDFAMRLVEELWSSPLARAPNESSNGLLFLEKILLIVFLAVVAVVLGIGLYSLTQDPTTVATAPPPMRRGLTDDIAPLQMMETAPQQHAPTPPTSSVEEQAVNAFRNILAKGSYFENEGTAKIIRQFLASKGGTATENEMARYMLKQCIEPKDKSPWNDLPTIIAPPPTPDQLKAAAQGDPQAQWWVGELYITSVAPDPKKAVYWLEKAATQGHAQAQDSLARCYVRGSGVEKNDRQAAFWFKRAAAQGLEDSQRELGEMYFEGKGVVQDYVEAHTLLSLAGRGGGKYARERREKVEKLMTQEQIVEAQRRAAEWMKAYK